MTKKDYILIADTIKSISGDGVTNDLSVVEELKADFVDRLCESLEKDNPKFNKSLFWQACGISENVMREFRTN